jgi:hypothetical protein
MDTWRPMELPKNLESSVRDMESTTFGMNVRYISDTDKLESSTGDQ